MSLYEKKHEYQEIYVDTVEDIDKIIAFIICRDKEELLMMTHQPVYRPFLEDKVMNHGKYVPA